MQIDKRINYKNFFMRIAGVELRDLALFLYYWPEIMGKRIADQAEIQKYENGVLYVSVANSVWMQELHILKPEVIKKLYRRIKLPIRDIIFYNKNQRKLSWIRSKK